MRAAASDRRPPDARAPQPAPPQDADGDGVAAPADCWDQNATVHPGAKEIPGNAIDDDCTGGDAPAKIAATIKNKWKAKNGRVWVSAMSVLEAPEGARVEVSCKGRRCPFKRRTATVNAKGNAYLLKFFKRKLRPKMTIEVRVDLPELDRPRRPLPHQARRRPEHAAPVPAAGRDEGANAADPVS